MAKKKHHCPKVGKKQKVYFKGKCRTKKEARRMGRNP